MSSRTILITGAGSGIGKGLSLYAAKKGYKIIATDLDGKSAEGTIDEVRQAGGEGRSFCLDVTNKESIMIVAESLADAPVDVLVNNAGMQFVSPLEEFPQEKWDFMISVMLNGACMMTKAFLPSMKNRNFGRIINIGSIHSLIASPYKSAYVAAKHGLVGFSKVIALETAKFDITINTLCPSYVRTPLVEKQIAEQARAHGIPVDDVIKNIMLKPCPKGEFVTIEELAGIMLFFISDYARNITGQTLAIDGGWTIQ